MPAVSPVDRPVLLSLRNVRKAFPGVLALDGVSLEVAAGEVHGLVGENGAGKSTLMAIASGALAADAGTVRIDGRLLEGDPQRARELGLAIVRQEPALMPDLSVAENLYLGVLARARPPIAQLHAWAAGWLREWDAECAISPRERAGSLSAEQRFAIEIVKALASEPRVLVLDEPTEHLAGPEVARLFEHIRALAARGVAVVYISHRIREVRSIAGQLTVLRDGRAHGPHLAQQLSEAQIVELIVGSTLDHAFPPKLGVSGSEGAPLFELQGFSGRGFSDVNLALQRGEILGFAGIQANGQRECLRALAGLRRARGSVRLEGRPMAIDGVRQAAASGVRYLPGDRHRDGLFGGLSVRENFSLRSLGRDRRGGLLSARAESERALAATARFAVKSAGLEAPVTSLSGGNQQKLMMAAVLDSAPAVMLVEEPTNGVDVGTRLQIYGRLREAAASGIAIVVTSSDAMELAGVCDRVAVFSRGKVVAELGGEAVSEHAITQAMLTSTGTRERHADRIPALWRWAAGDAAPLVSVSLAILLLGAYASMVNEFYLSGRNLGGMMVMLATLALVAFGQQALMLVGGIDLSVGPLMGLVQVLASFTLLPEVSAWQQALGGMAIVVACLGLGFVNWLLVEPGKVPPMVATLITYMAVQAVSLMLRPVAAGTFDSDLTDLIDTRLAGVPVTLLAALALAALLEGLLFRSRLGIGWRGLGSRPEAARVAGVPVRGFRLAAYLGCSLLSGLAAISLMSQVGIGDPRAGLSYTLASIAAAVIGGASLGGGRGSFIGALLGAALMTEVNAVTGFLQLDSAWQQYLLGGMVLGAVALYSKSRQAALAS